MWILIHTVFLEYTFYFLGWVNLKCFRNFTNLQQTRRLGKTWQETCMVLIWVWYHLCLQVSVLVLFVQIMHCFFFGICQQKDFCCTESHYVYCDLTHPTLSQVNVIFWTVVMGGSFVPENVHSRISFSCCLKLSVTSEKGKEAEIYIKKEQTDWQYLIHLYKQIVNYSGKHR